MTDDEPLFSADQLRAAAAALGIHPQPDDPNGTDTAFLLGILLGAIETACRDLARTDLPKHGEGFLAAMLAFADNDPASAARGWAVALNDRLNRTAVELYEAVEPGGGRAFTDVAGPSMLAAANMLNLVNRSTVDQDTLAATFATADQNLKAARKNLGEARQSLRGQGFRL